MNLNQSHKFIHPTINKKQENDSNDNKTNKHRAAKK